MPEIGQTISHYKITGNLGKGGMGEVFLADDTTLDRKVALKFLPDAFTSDPERMARFEREAKLLASLNHPNIAGIYELEQEDGNRFLVLEYVEGETLQARLSKGALPLEDALELCRQIAEGLEAAHEKGVIHRDLKPANVMITAEEKIKILDFGLAKALSDETQGVDSSQSPTLTEAMTQPGVILGTAAYMSPEQAKGKSVDKRADIWAFGCILYECLTGKRAFEGETVTETLAAVIKEDPDWNTLPSTTPQNIQFVLLQCMEKDRSQRFRDVADLQLLVEKAQGFSVTVTSINQKYMWLWKSVACFFIAAFALIFFIHFRGKPSIIPEVFNMKIPISENLHVPEWNGMSLSPDGAWLAFNAPGPDYSELIWVRAMDSLEAKPLPGTETISPRRFLFWSPDSKFIAFSAEQKLKVINISSGALKTICNLPGRVNIGGSWNNDNDIILGMLSKGIMHVSAKGGDLSPLTIMDQEPVEAVHMSPVFLPDGNNFLYLNRDVKRENIGIYQGSLKSKTEEYNSKRILNENVIFSYVSSQNPGRGYLLYLKDNTLYAQLFDENSLKIVGEPLPVVEQVSSSTGPVTAGNFTVTNSGILAYQNVNSQMDSVISQDLVWVDREGKKISQTGKPGVYNNFQLSNDETKIVYDYGDTSDTNIWVLDLIRGVTTKITNNPSIENLPIWSPDDLLILFPSLRLGPFNLYVKAATGTGQSKLHINMGTDNGWGTDWSEDKRFILYQRPGDTTGQDLWIAPQEEDSEPYPYLQEAYDEQEGVFSPNGNWIAYVSNQTGLNEIYVQSFPSPDDKFTISTDGGFEPCWSKDGTELFYVSADRNLMTVPIKLTPDFIPGSSRQLFPVPVKANNHSYAVSGDGKRFLILKHTEGQKADLSITVMVNWQTALNK